MEEDNSEEPLLPGLDPKIKSAKIHLAELVSEETTKKYTKKQMKEIKDKFNEEQVS